MFLPVLSCSDLELFKKLNLLKQFNLLLEFSGITYVVRFGAANLQKGQTITTDSEKILSCHRALRFKICRLLPVLTREGLLSFDTALWVHSGLGQGHKNCSSLGFSSVFEVKVGFLVIFCFFWAPGFNLFLAYEYTFLTGYRHIKKKKKFFPGPLVGFFTGELVRIVTIPMETELSI